MTRDPTHFPDCDGDPAARHLSVPATAATELDFADLSPGGYAVALFHDENDNGRLDKRFGIPTEGFGFSNNPHFWFGPPSFKAAKMTLTAGPMDETVRLTYLL